MLLKFYNSANLRFSIKMAKYFLSFIQGGGNTLICKHLYTKLFSLNSSFHSTKSSFNFVKQGINFLKSRIKLLKPSFISHKQKKYGFLFQEIRIQFYYPILIIPLVIKLFSTHQVAKVQFQKDFQSLYPLLCCFQGMR